MFLSVTHHSVLDCGAAADFQRFFRVLHAELIAELSLLLLLSKKTSFKLQFDLLSTCY